MASGALQATSERAARNLAGVKHIIYVFSGKGGVGKSTVSSQLAWTLSKLGMVVGLLDVDLTGPSTPQMLGVSGKEVRRSASGWLPVAVAPGLSTMSIGFLLGDQDAAVVWRGPRKTGLVQQFLTDVQWGELDFLIVDTPPGVTDEHLTIAQTLKAGNVAGAVVITTPQEVAMADVRKQLNFCKRTNTRVIGVVENMRGFVCPHCKAVSEVFTAAGSGPRGMTEKAGVALLGSLPLDQRLLAACETGRALVDADPAAPSLPALFDIAQAVAAAVGSPLDPVSALAGRDGCGFSAAKAQSDVEEAEAEAEAEAGSGTTAPAAAATAPAAAATAPAAAATVAAGDASPPVGRPGAATRAGPDVPANANEHCPGAGSEQAGKASACAGCPNQGLCASGAAAKPDDTPRLVAERLKDVKHIVFVLSGKGGVGKSTVATQLAMTLAAHDKTVGLLDVDITGPSTPQMTGARGRRLRQSGSGWAPAWLGENLAVVSVGFMVPDPDAAVVWRGARKNHLVRQFLTDTHWGDLDFLIVDTPPGVTDELMSIVQYTKEANVAGAVVVTTPQEVAMADVRKQLNFCKRTNTRVIGVVENMRGFVCPHCKAVSEVFTAAGSGPRGMTEKAGVALLGSLPLDQRLLAACETGRAFVGLARDAPAAVELCRVAAAVAAAAGEAGVPATPPDEIDPILVGETAAGVAAQG